MWLSDGFKFVLLQQKDSKSSDSSSDASQEKRIGLLSGVGRIDGAIESEGVLGSAKTLGVNLGHRSQGGGISGGIQKDSSLLVLESASSASSQAREAGNGAVVQGQKIVNRAVSQGQELIKGALLQGQEVMNRAIPQGQKVLNGVVSQGREVLNGAVSGIQEAVKGAVSEEQNFASRVNGYDSSLSGSVDIDSGIQRIHERVRDTVKNLKNSAKILGETGEARYGVVDHITNLNGQGGRNGQSSGSGSSGYGASKSGSSGPGLSKSGSFGSSSSGSGSSSDTTGIRASRLGISSSSRFQLFSFSLILIKFIVW